MQRFKHHLLFATYFCLGFFLTAVALVAIAYLAFSLYFQNKIYPGVEVAGQTVGGMTKEEAKVAFETKEFDNLSFQFNSPEGTVSAKAPQLNIQLDKNLMIERAYSIGRQTKNPYYNFLQIIAASQRHINLPLEVTRDNDVIKNSLATLAPKIEYPPVDAVYTFNPTAGPDKRGRVVAFQKSQDGRAINYNQLADQVAVSVENYYFTAAPEPSVVNFTVPTIVVTPTIASTTADDLGIKDLLGRGESYFYDSIPGRVYNIGLGTEKVSGRLVHPGEVFSFSEAIGTVSAVFGFQKAYAIIQGKTVLDDGGGVCQVSTTLYRAVLNSGLPVVERAGHSYRVGFYEQGGFLPGMDATVYPPDPDFKFRNDTGKTILIQAIFDRATSKLTFEIFGTDDGRETTITGPVITSITPAPEPIYQDDPTLPIGQVKQTETAHAGAKTYFKRQVVRNGQTIINETVNTDYVPWPARFLRGTKT